MTWARLKIVDCTGGNSTDKDGKQEERLFNLDQRQWWIGRGANLAELQYGSHPPVLVETGEKRIKQLTGTTGGYVNER